MNLFLWNVCIILRLQFQLTSPIIFLWPIHPGTFSQSSELKMDKIKSHPTLFLFNILFHAKKCQITQAQWVANAILCWHNQIELVLSGFKKKTQWSADSHLTHKERSAGYNYETIVCWQTDWQANWFFQYCKEKEVQCEKLAVTHDLRCVAVFGEMREENKCPHLTCKDKKEKNKTI